MVLGGGFFMRKASGLYDWALGLGLCLGGRCGVLRRGGILVER